MTNEKRPKLKCECGAVISGVSEKHAEANLKIHKEKSKRHKEYVRIVQKMKRELKKGEKSNGN